MLNVCAIIVPMNNETLVSELTGKDENKAQDAAKNIVSTGNAEAFFKLCAKTEYLFDFIKANVNRRLEGVVNKQNFRNVLVFLNEYCPDLEDFVVGSLAKYADEDLTDELLELLENGNEDQKTYCARYFSYIPDTSSCELLTEYAFSDNESLAYNSAMALGAMKWEPAYNGALEMLKSDDEFSVLKAVKFLGAYGNKSAVADLLKTVKTGAMAENIAGEIPFLVPLSELLKGQNREDALFCVSKILSGLGEILPLNQIFSFELYDVLAGLIVDNKKEKNGLIAVILLKALSKFEMICENDEYTFDEDKNTKSELNEVLNLLNAQPQSFWNEQKELVKTELSKTGEKERVISAIHLISELKIEGASGDLINLISLTNDEVIVCEAVCAVKNLGKTNQLDKAAILSKINDANKKAIIENCF